MHEKEEEAFEEVAREELLRAGWHQHRYYRTVWMAPVGSEIDAVDGISRALVVKRSMDEGGDRDESLYKALSRLESAVTECLRRLKLKGAKMPSWSGVIMYEALEEARRVLKEYKP